MGQYPWLITPLIILLVSCASGSTPTVPNGQIGSTETSQAQATDSGEIQGTVFDAISGAPIPSANIVTDPPTGSVTTGSDGQYAIIDVKPGPYTVVASKGRYIRATVTITVTSGALVTADLQLLPGPISETPGLIPASTPSATPTSTLEFIMEPIQVSVICSVYGQSPVRVERGQPIVFTWMWTADRDDQVTDHIQWSHYQVLLDGKEIQASRISSIEYVAEKDWFAVTWYTDPVVLDVGRHLTERNLSWYDRISDGWNTYGPGGTYETLHDTCTIIVE